MTLVKATDHRGGQPANGHAAPPSQTSKHEHFLIVVPPGLAAHQIEHFQQGHPQVQVTVCDPEKGLPPKDVLKTVTTLATVRLLPNPEDAPNLRLIHLLSAGYDSLLKHPVFTDTDIPITNVSGIHGPPISEWVLMNWLVHSRQYNLGYELQKQRKWGSHAQWGQTQDHVGKTVGIVGYGSIGRQIARVATAMGMRVLAYTFTPRDTPESKRDRGYIIPKTGDPDGTLPEAWFSGGETRDLHAFLAQGLDHVVVSVPLTPATTGMFGAQEFRVLSEHRPGQAGPFFTNISRGQVVDQPALIAALEQQHLSGAAIDVAVPEPLPPDDPLWTAPNIHITPHVSSIGVEYMERALDILSVNLERRRKGEPLLNLCNREKGY
ncbi:hypothetical protein KEM52_005724 [Ascosphaera acerosa]|nr:hypothetical protein KEM52_005724 [Ascosphaera acerosa]